MELLEYPAVIFVDGAVMTTAATAHEERPKPCKLNLSLISVFFPYGVEGSGRWSESGVEGSTGATSVRGPGVEGMKSGT